MIRILITIIALASAGVLPSPARAYMTPEEIFDVPAEAQTSDAPQTSEEAAAKTEIQNRIFYRNGETKSVAPEAVSSDPTAQPAVDPTTDVPVSDAVPAPMMAPPEPVEADPLPEEELLIQKTSKQADTAPTQVEATKSFSLPLIISGAVIGIILLGGMLFLILRLVRRFRPTLSREAIAPPPITESAIEASSPRLEKAMGVKSGETL